MQGEFYHIYNRGNSKQKIFHDQQDYDRFLFLLFICNSGHRFNVFNLIRDGSSYDAERGKNLVNIGVYCIMQNHFHILITETVEGGISRFMQKLSTAYVMYYNQKYKRTGSLFEGKFKAEHAVNDRYLKYLFSYIHLNPIKLLEPKWKELGIKSKGKAVNYLKSYRYSSFEDYLAEDRAEAVILNKESFPGYFPTVKTFINEIFDWINYEV